MGRPLLDIRTLLYKTLKRKYLLTEVLKHLHPLQVRHEILPMFSAQQLVDSKIYGECRDQERIEETQQEAEETPASGGVPQDDAHQTESQALGQQDEG